MRIALCIAKQNSLHSKINNNTIVIIYITELNLFTI